MRCVLLLFGTNLHVKFMFNVFITLFNVFITL